MKENYYLYLFLFLLLFTVYFTGCGTKNTDEWAWDAVTFEEPEELSESILSKYLSEDGYLNPEAFGATGDGVTDDSLAIQKAVNSGYNVRFEDKTYYIAADRYIRINGKKDFHMEGGTIHKAASPDNYHLFLIEECEDCSFSDMYIYSEFTCKDILVPEDHMRPEETKNSNVLAFSGYNNRGIRFLNNSFDFMDADYWLNAADGQYWRDVLIDDWESATSLNPLFSRLVDGLTIRNATVKNNDGCGDGDHCLYICHGSKDILIEDSDFTGSENPPFENACVVLTFHGGKIEDDTQPKNILIRNTEVHGLKNRGLYVGDGVTIRVEDSAFTKESDRFQHNELIFGIGNFTFDRCTFTGPDIIFNGMLELNLKDCKVTGGTNNPIITAVKKGVFEDSIFVIGEGSASFESAFSERDDSDSAHDYTFEGCSLEHFEYW